MSLYEHVFIARQDVSSGQVDTMVESFSQIIEQNGGQVTKKEYWGLKTMAYRIKKNRKGHYVLFNLDAPADAVLEMERNERLHEDVLRTMTVRVDALEEGPSIVMQGRRERDGGARRGRHDGDRDRGRDGDGRGRDGDGKSRDGEAPKAEAKPDAEAPKAEAKPDAGAPKAEAKAEAPAAVEAEASATAKVEAEADAPAAGEEDKA